MIILPIILITLTASSIIKFQMNSIHQSYDLETETLQIITNPVQIWNRITRGVYNEIKLNTLKNPEKLEDEQYYESLNNSLKDKYSFIAVRKGEEYVFVGDEDKLDITRNQLPPFGSYSIDLDGGLYIGGRFPFLIKGQDFYFKDGQEGTIFVITDLRTLIPQIKMIAIQSIFAFILILLMTAFILIYWIYRSMLKPLNVLKLATNRIKEGDLDTSINVNSKDEIGQLCDDFEEMRIRLKILMEDRIQYEEDMKEMISNISHDLKTPLTAIKGYSEGLLDGVAVTSKKQEKYIKTINMKANEISSLVDELSLYAIIDDNTIPYSLEKININNFFNDCIDDLKLELEVKNIKVEYINKADETTYILADPEQMKRVIRNIVGNSIKYMDKEEGKIRFEIRQDHKYIQVDITDNGRGIAERDQAYIFDRFYRTDSSRNSNTGGTGLGLAIVKKIIERHQGKTWVKSELGKGTTISFTLNKK